MTGSRGVIAGADELVERAVAQAELDDLGPPTWREGLERVVESLGVSPDYSPAGLDYLQNLFVKALWNRLRVIDYAKGNPQVRGGGCRPTVRGPRDATHGDDAREQPARPGRPPSIPAQLGGRRLDPAADVGHTPLRPAVRHEAGTAAARRAAPRGRGQGNAALGVGGQPYRMPLRAEPGLQVAALGTFLLTDDYVRWLYECDVTSAYEYEKLVLQILQSRAPGTWSLKMPSHAAFIDTLVATFPDVRIVWTHRDPYRATASLCSTLQASHGVVGTADRAVVARSAVDQMKKSVERPLQHRELLTDERVHHLYYADVMRDPLREMTCLYAWAGEELTPQTADRMQRWLDANPPDRFGSRRYTLDEYGLSKEALVPVFAEYLATFDIEMEGSA